MDEEQINPEQMKQIETMKKMVMKKILDKAAVERLGRIKLVKPDLALQLELYLIQLYQAGKIKGVITDEQLKMLLDTLTTGKKDFKIIR
jgi:programmed cell death protein 5